ncbi:LD-carboxypeptidase [Saccharicrinis sp. FJH62]|uniref:S66 peptidase family protein n=1 Tax=Saccharicrinis sp. FJH62 TaxID=3344657 RepID=UPI0035D45B13
MIIPDRLKKGDAVALVSPSGRIEKDILELAESFLTEWGLEVRTGKHAAGSHHIYSGTVDERINDLQSAMDDPDIKAVFCARGGYGAVQYIDRVSISEISDFPKWVVGFSDISVLHSMLNRSGIATIHGPMPKNFEALITDREDKSLEYLRQLLFEGSIEYSWKGESTHNEFTVSGELVGGNLSVMAGLRGTLYEPFYDGKILFLEDLNENLYHADRLLQNLRLGGIFNRINALLVGAFTNMKDSDPPFGKDIHEIILDVTKDSDIPVVFGFQAGHQKPNYPLPFGVRMLLMRDNGINNLHNILGIT